MNANQLINMIIRQVVRKFVNKGVDAGVNKLASGGKQGKQARHDVKRARQAARMTRRLNK
ncbi:hypothetical protein [Thalassovita aquimarina]|uniref:Uncharacterized protein n=1 Tax=Thalassovita aquimarina TaxID=2785917 RepID=A0ABS5HW92_9RHOB|nr:hypothetical protein [Thalassovita aquimarina]MBR9653252.1 hypothetical protein [Thalassovita aquimarina]